MRRFVPLVVLLACNGPAEQSPQCARYVECVRARDVALGIQTDVERFLPGGACWGGFEGGELCTNGCENGLAFLATDPVSSSLPECVP